jgi:amidase
VSHFPFPLEEATIDDLRRQIEAGELTSAELTRLYLERIEALNHQGPCLHAVLEVNPDALAIAEALDAELGEKGPRGPLHGIPVLLKDNIATADRMETTAGSLALLGHRPRRDAFLVERLRAAGAVILGKANLSEWSNIRARRPSSGWSARGGQCRNPYALDRSPSGSSSGTAAAVAANLAAAGIGTETNGSIVSPASVCSLVGIKPTVGLVSRSGIIPISHSQDTAGPMARTVRDAAFLLGAITGMDPCDGATRAGEGKALTDYTPFLIPDGLKGARLGISLHHLGPHPEVRRMIRERIDDLGAAGADLVELEGICLDDNGEWEVFLHELKAGLHAYLEELDPPAPRTLTEIIRFNEENAAREMPFFGQEHFLKADQRGPLTSRAYLDAQEKRRQARLKLENIFEEHRLDAIVALTEGPAWLIDLVHGDRSNCSSGVPTLAAVPGFPHVTVPAGYFRGLPFGLSFIGRAFSEPCLLRLAYAFEQRTKVRTPPAFVPTVETNPDAL